MTEDDGCSELHNLIPRVLQALHAKKVWEGVTNVDEIRCEKFKDLSKPHIVKLTPVKSFEESPVVVKFESKIPCGYKFFKIEPKTVEIHQLLSDHGLTTKLLAYSLKEEKPSDNDTNSSNSLVQPNFTVEAIGVCYFDMAACEADPNYFDTANSATETGGIMAKLAARLHKKINIQWFDKYRSDIIQLCPLMKDEPHDSPFWVMMRTDALGQARLAAKLTGERAENQQFSENDIKNNDVQVNSIFLNQKRSYAPTNEDMKRIAALLPKPCGQHASRIVTVHGDLWVANVVKDNLTDVSFLIDLEGVTVSYAATELAQFSADRGVSKIYLEEFYLMEGQGEIPTEDEIDKFWFEVLIAGHIQVSILRPMCWQDQILEVDSVKKEITYCEKFLAYVEKLRRDWDLTSKILHKAADIYAKGGDIGHWCSDEVMDSVFRARS